MTPDRKKRLPNKCSIVYLGVCNHAQRVAFQAEQRTDGAFYVFNRISSRSRLHYGYRYTPVTALIQND